jgi:hypothetical protein
MPSGLQPGCHRRTEGSTLRDDCVEVVAAPSESHHFVCALAVTTGAASDTEVRIDEQQLRRVSYLRGRYREPRREATEAECVWGLLQQHFLEPTPCRLQGRPTDCAQVRRRAESELTCCAV